MKGVGVVMPPHVAEIVRALPPDLKRAVKQALLAIRADPEIGTALERELAGYRRYRVRRFRIVYGFDRTKKILRVVAVGHRRNVYEDLAASLRRAKQLAAREQTRTFQESAARRPGRLRTHVFRGRGLQPGLSWDDWNTLRSLAYEDHGG